MRTQRLLGVTAPSLILAAALALPVVASAQARAQGTPIRTNKDRVLTLAVQGQIAPAQPSRAYAVTWDGRPKVLVGTGGINYNLKVGDPIFGWAGDRATMGVAVEGAGDERGRAAWIGSVAVGNEVRLLSGAARGERGVVTGKFGGYALLHFDDEVLDRLAVGDVMQARASGIGLEIDGFDQVFVHGLAPEVLEALVSGTAEGRLQVPVVKEIPGEIMGQGAGAGSLSGHWNIQTSYPPDIDAHGLRDLRFGDIVYLRDIQTDYGKGYYKGGATIGIISSGPSEMSGVGIAVTPILSSREGALLLPRIDPQANIGRYLGIAMRPTVPSPSAASPGGVFRTNKETLITTAVEAVVQPPGARDYSVGYDGTPKVRIGMGSINYTVSFGDPAYGWANADHVEPDVTVQGRDAARPSDCAIAILAGIGNPAEVISGEARGGKGFYIGRHAGSHDLVWFPPEVRDNLALNDRIHVKARGVGLRIEGFEDVRVNKTSPEFLERMGIAVEGDRLVVPVVKEIPGHIMGSGIGSSFIETLDYDIQTTCPETVEQYDLKSLNLGDVVAIRDHYNFRGAGRYEGAVTIGVIIHGWSDYAGHGPGVTTVLSALPGRIETRIDPHANAAYYLGIREAPGR
jgi:hypothetical protein